MSREREGEVSHQITVRITGPILAMIDEDRGGRTRTALVHDALRLYFGLIELTEQGRDDMEIREAMSLMLPGRGCAAPQSRMRSICMYCHVLIHDGETGPSGEVSHGICDACMLVHHPDVLDE